MAGFIKGIKGITLMELIISLGLGLTALGLGYNLYSIAAKSYNDSNKEWIAQTNANQSANYIKKELESTFYAQIDYDLSESLEEGDKGFYLNGDNELMFAEYNKAPVRITDSKYSVTFEKAKNSDWTSNSPANNRVNNAITFTINVLDEDNSIVYSTQSSVFLKNMPENNEGSTNYTGTRIKYQRTGPDFPVPTPTNSPSCFIATAAYGSPAEPSVLLLRSFRDEYLLTNAPGRKFVELYYQYSPAAADIIRTNAFLKTAVRTVLTPFVGLACMLTHEETRLPAVILWCALIYLLHKRKEKPILLDKIR